jgi:hypothetical protein
VLPPSWPEELQVKFGIQDIPGSEKISFLQGKQFFFAGTQTKEHRQDQALQEQFEEHKVLTEHQQQFHLIEHAEALHHQWKATSIGFIGQGHGPRLSSTFSNPSASMATCLAKDSGCLFGEGLKPPEQQCLELSSVSERSRLNRPLARTKQHKSVI